MTRLSFYDDRPHCQSFHDAVVEGLSRKDKSIPPKFFYDEQGSKLFERICRQPEYYPPAVECRLLSEISSEIASLAGAGRVLIEPGVGSAAKVRLILEDLRPSAFVAMDISFDYLKSIAADLSAEYDWLSVHAVHADFTHSLPVPKEVPAGRRLLFFPGSSLGNFEPDEALRFLSLIHNTLGEEGMLLIGVDTKKSASLLNAAYNDAAGVTAQFNINLLHRMRRELSAILEPSGFQHYAFYNTVVGRVEMHLVSRRTQQLRIDDYQFHMNEGESLHTENSYKYTPDEFLQLASKSGYESLRYWQDSEGLFAIYLLGIY